VLAGDLAFAAPLLTGTSELDSESLCAHLNDGRFLDLVTDLVNRGFLVVSRG
jgi:hypothetical protein